VRWHLPWSELDPVCDEPEGWLIARLIPAMRLVLEAHGVPGDRGPDDKDEPEPNTIQGNFLIAVGGRLFEIGTQWQVSESAYGVAAIGSGSLAALGAFCALSSSEDLTPAVRIDAVLSAAEQWTTSVSRPFTTLFVPAQ
jgi:hypothetical protein